MEPSSSVSGSALTLRLNGGLLPPNDLRGLYGRLRVLGTCQGIRLQELGRVKHGDRSEPILALRIKGPEAEPKRRLRLLVTSGVHGNEPGGPAAALELAARFRHMPGIDATVVLPVNPFGYEDDTRRNGEGLDLNRAFADDEDPTSLPDEIRAVRRVFDEHSFDLALDLHEAPSSSAFFAIHVRGAALAAPVMKELGRTHPIMQEGTSTYHLVAPGVAYTTTPGTLKGYAAERGARWSYTLEAPQQGISYRDRVGGLVQMARGIIANAQAELTTSRQLPVAGAGETIERESLRAA